MKHLKPFSEAVGDTFAQDLKDFCEMNLAYLMDEELDISILPVRSGLGLGFKLTLVLDDNPRLWNDIKDHMIPFLTRLSNQYEIKKYPRIDKKDIMIGVTRDIEAAKNHWPHRKTDIFYQVNKLINDDTKSGLYDVLDSYITEMEFLIDGYKQQPKKGILTKIKSFFK
jgi:hypothetical protein